MSELRWVPIIRRYAERLNTQEGYRFFGQELCEFLLHPYVEGSDGKEHVYRWKDEAELISYLRDYRTLYEGEYRFHSTWAHLGRYKNAAVYDQRAMRMLEELICELSGLL